MVLSIIVLLIAMESTMCSLANNINVTYTCIPTEKNALLKFKASLSSLSSDKLSSWIDTNYDCCTWQGVECDKATGHVIGLHLGNKDGKVDNMLQGSSIDSSLLELKYLGTLDLSRNDFHGSQIPEFIGSMKQLQHLNLSNANFAGIVPHQLGNLSILRTLDLEDNENLIVDDLTWASNLSSLEYLDMSHVDLSRANNIVEVLSKLSSILVLSLSKSGLDNTNLAHSCVNYTLFTNVQFLDLSLNYLEGNFPCFIHNMTSLSFLDLSYNHYNSFDPRFLASKNLTHLNLEANSINHTSDWISDFMWDKCHLKSLNLNNNKFNGDISGAFKKLSRCWGQNMETLDLGDNKLHGHFPQEIVNLRALRVLSLSGNTLSGEIPASLGQLSNLEEINLYNNSFGGTLSEAHFAKLSRLETIDASSNYMLKLRVGYEWTPLFHLKYLLMQSVEIGGPFPHWLQTQNHTLIKLDLSNCSIRGTLPKWLSSLTNLKELDLSNNHIEGSIPELSSTMIVLDLSNNKINGSIPDSLCQMKSLDGLDLSRTVYQLTGAIPSSIGGDNSLELLQLSNNSLTGEIPSTMMNCTSYLAAIRLRNNEFYGPIPLAYCQLSLLQIMDLANNKLTRNIPRCFGDFLGMVKGSFAVTGKKKYVKIILGVFSAIVLLLSLGIPLFVIRKLEQRKREKELHKLLILDGYTDDNEVSDSHYLRLFTYASIQSATHDFSSDYKLGEGGFGPVYKGKTPEGKDIAVKLLSEQSGQGVLEFKTELILISKLQHVNLVKLIGFCVHGDDKMIIYDYMLNKSLDFFLFISIREEQLNWQKRFSIITGIAQGLIYLHKYSRIKIIHRDLKPSNILLDQNMIPKISDFGLARIIKQDISEAKTNRRVGTYGYMALEYAMQGIFSVKSDVYSFGVLVLEIVSGRRNNSFHEIGGPLSLVEYAWELWRKDCFLELIDPTLIHSCVIDQLKRCIHIGFLCVENHAVDRPTVEDVMSMIKNEMANLPMPKSPTFITRNN
ncbi:hypothetical protein CASFOL_020328 [Castilleja foliolosa]|uniref:non-specific serine/threonine protein kinase n=1 Tax=Castilleja foliolosa TaxID=1961234 RepID=A0ABD3D0J4_9LAMI